MFPKVTQIIFLLLFSDESVLKTSNMKRVALSTHLTVTVTGEVLVSIYKQIESLTCKLFQKKFDIIEKVTLSKVCIISFVGLTN